MQIDIAQHIEKLLFQHETVIVPTFGGFTATRSPASLDAVGGTIAPPSKTLAFNENLTVDDGILVHDLAYTYSLNEDESRRLVLDFVDNTRAALDQREIVTLPGVGRLYKNYAQKVQFLPDTTNFNTDSFGLPKINFATVPRSTEQAVTAEAEPEIAVAAVSSNGKAKTRNTSAANSNGKANENGSSPSNVVQVLLESAEVDNAPVPAPEQVLADISRQVQKKTAFTPANWALAGILVGAIAIGSYFSLTKKASSATDAVVESNTTVPMPGVGDLAAIPTPKDAATVVVPEENDDVGGDIPDEVDEYMSKKIEAEGAMEQAKVATSKKAESAAKAAKKEVIPAGSRRCVLIIGTFQDKENVSKLIDKLKGAGFDTYHRRVNGHQVGIEFHYTDLVEVQNQIKALQTLTGEENIWIKKK